MNNVTKVMLISFFVNFFLAIFKVLSGFFAHSSALIADGIHSFSDLSTDIIAIFGSTWSKKPADRKHPFGHGRLEYLTSTVIGIVVLFLGFLLIKNSLKGTQEIASIIVIIVSILTIFFKYLLSKFVLKKGYEYHNSILIASGKESSADVISSFVVLISAFFLQFQDKIPLFIYADVIATIIVGFFIIKTGFLILKENVSTLLGEQETDTEYIEKVKNIILKNPFVKGIDELVLLKFGSYYKLIAEVGMDSSISIKESHDALEKIEKSLIRFDKRIRYQTIHVNPYEEDIFEKI